MHGVHRQALQLVPLDKEASISCASSPCSPDVTSRSTLKQPALAAARDRVGPMKHQQSAAPAPSNNTPEMC
jgi:hypothetical protein